MKCLEKTEMNVIQNIDLNICSYSFNKSIISILIHIDRVSIHSKLLTVGLQTVSIEKYKVLQT